MITEEKRIADILYNMTLVGHHDESNVLDGYEENISLIASDIEMLKLKKSKLYNVLEDIAFRHTDRENWMVDLQRARSEYDYSTHGEDGKER